MPYVSIVLDIPGRTIGSLRADNDRTSKQESMAQLMHEINGVVGGMRKGHIRACLASVRASATVTCDFASVVDGTDDVTIGGTTLSVEASPSGETQFDGGSSDATLTDNLAAAVNGNSTIQKFCFAVSDGASVVTLYSVFPGPIGNLITLAETGNGFTISGANFASGASDEVDSYAFGYDPATA